MTPAQCRAARGLIDWNQDELASAAGVSVVTIRNFENDKTTPQRATLDVLRRALEHMGVHFIDGEQPGVRVPWNFICRTCGAKYVARRIETPFRPRERATCQHCMHELPPRDGKDLIQYELIARPAEPVVSDWGEG
jgi:transcriptional regulator with XRE-family HTH domain